MVEEYRLYSNENYDVAQKNPPDCVTNGGISDFNVVKDG